MPPLYNLTPQDQLISPQIGAISSNPPRIRYSDYIESLSNSLPALEAADYQRRMLEEQMALEREARKQASRDSSISLGIKGIETGVQLGMNPIARKYGSKVLSALAPKPVSALSTIANAPAGIQSAIQPWASQVIPQAQNALSIAAPALGTAPQMGGFTSALTTPATQATGYTSALAPANTAASTATQTGLLGTGLSPLGAGLTGLGAYSTGNLFRDTNMSKGQKIGAGFLTGAAQGFLASGFNPIGALVSGIFGAVGSRNKGLCIIATSCYGEKSHEVEICRQYRDKHLDRETLRGYYSISESLIPLMEGNPEIKEYVRVNLIDPLVVYGEWKLGYTQTHPDTMTCATVKNFLSYCKDRGIALKQFVRSNGEIL